MKTESDDKQSLYISKFKILMDDAIVKKSEIEARKKKGHSIGLTSTAIADEFNPTLFNNAFNFGFYNTKLDFHQFSIVQGTAYSVLKDQGALTLKVYDLLNQNTNVVISNNIFNKLSARFICTFSCSMMSFNETLSVFCR